MKILKKLLSGLEPTISGRSMWLLFVVVIFCTGLYIYLAATQPHTDHEFIPLISVKHSEFKVCESNGLLYYYLEQALQDNGFTSDLALRSISIVSGVGAIIVLYLSGKLLGGPRIGLICAWVLAINNAHLAFAATNRFYCLNEFFCALATYIFIRAYTTERWKWWLAYAVAIVLCISTMIFSSLLMVCHACILVLLPAKRRSWIAFIVTGIIGITVFMGLSSRDPDGSGRFLYEKLTYAGEYFEYWLHNCFIAPHSNIILSNIFNQRIHIWGLYIAIAPVLIIAAIVGLKPKAERPDRITASLLLSIILIVACLTWYSLQVKTILNSYNLSWLIPAFALIVGYVLARYRTLLYVFAIALISNPFNYCSTYVFLVNNDITHNFLVRQLHRGDIVLFDTECLRPDVDKNMGLNSSLTPFMDSIPNVHQYIDRSLPFNSNDKPTVVFGNMDLISTTLRSVNDDARLTNGRLWLIYSPINYAIIEDLVSSIASNNKYIIAHTAPFNRWEIRLMVIAPVN